MISVKIQVNQECVELLEIRNITPQTNTPETINQYEYRQYGYRRGLLCSVTKGQVRHRYGDKIESLVSRVLLEVAFEQEDFQKPLSDMTSYQAEEGLTWDMA